MVQKHNRYSPALIHSHTFFELVYVYDGKCTQEISGQTISMKTGDFCVIPPSVEHSISVYDDSIIINIMLRRNTLPVSYTHLDVYKRQPSTWAIRIAALSA